MAMPARFAIALVLAILAPPMVGENLIENPDFDTGIPTWLNFSETNGTSIWNPFDIDESDESGSALVTNFAPDTKVTGAGLGQTIPAVQEGQEYVFDSQVFVASGQDRTADVIIELNFYRDLEGPGSCSNFISPPHRGVHNGVFDSWQELRAVTTAPKGAVCARLFMATYKHQAGGEFQAYLDVVRLVPAGIFTDGFESGDLELWSSQSP